MHETVSQFNEQLLSQISNLQQAKNIKIQIPSQRVGANNDYIDIQESKNILFSDPSNALLNSFSIGQFAKDGDNALLGHSKEGKMMMTDNQLLMNINSAKNSEQMSAFKNGRQGTFLNQVTPEQLANTFNNEPNVVTFLSENFSGDGQFNEHSEQISKNIEMLKYLKNLQGQTHLSGIDEAAENNTQT
jgi:hypothetical protein